MRSPRPGSVMPEVSWGHQTYLKHVGGSAPASAPSGPLMHTSVHTNFFFYHVVLSNADFLD